MHGGPPPASPRATERGDTNPARPGRRLSLTGETQTASRIGFLARLTDIALARTGTAQTEGGSTRSARLKPRGTLRCGRCPGGRDPGLVESPASHSSAERRPPLLISCSGYCTGDPASRTGSRRGGDLPVSLSRPPRHAAHMHTASTI